ncbi:hypothetical protein ABTD92_20155, partial [Acinetobacter baumannii]
MEEIVLAAEDAGLDVQESDDFEREHVGDCCFAKGKLTCGDFVGHKTRRSRRQWGRVEERTRLTSRGEGGSRRARPKKRDDDENLLSKA